MSVPTRYFHGSMARLSPGEALRSDPLLDHGRYVYATTDYLKALTWILRWKNSGRMAEDTGVYIYEVQVDETKRATDDYAETDLDWRFESAVVVRVCFASTWGRLGPLTETLDAEPDSEVRTQALLQALEQLDGVDMDIASNAVPAPGHAWRPLLHIKAGFWVGVQADQAWFGTETRPTDALNPLGLLPLFTRERSEVEESISLAAAAHGLDRAAALGLIPFDEMARTAVDMKSDYWTGLALEWGPDAAGFDTALAQEVVDAGWASQRTRHTARRWLKTQP